MVVRLRLHISSWIDNWFSGSQSSFYLCLNRLKYLDQTVILSIVFTTFSESFSQRLFASFSWLSLGGLSLVMLFILLLVVGILFLLVRALSFSKEDQIAAIFCGSTKSLVHGVAIGKVLFPSAAIFGLVLLPVMLYHLQQLILGSLLARHYEKNKPWINSGLVIFTCISQLIRRPILDRLSQHLLWIFLLGLARRCIWRPP